MEPSEAEILVKTAVQLRAAYPLAPAAMILDVVMKDSSHDIDFVATGQPFANWLHPPSPFSLLLREAFAPQIPLSLFEMPDDPDEPLPREFLDAWGDALQLFFGRFGLWHE